MKQLSFFESIIVDSFAGGGGASTGIEMATGMPVNIAIDHDDSAIAMHRMNHPFTEHYREDIWAIDPRTVCRGRHVRMAWFSPDCKHFSRAKGKALKDRNIRGLAWVVLRWAGTVRPDVVMLENVPEFVTWCPVRKGKPVKSKTGQTYRKWRSQLEALGYAIETKELVAADYGAPTTRKRFVLIARCDGKPIVFPNPTHGRPDSQEVKIGKLKPYRTAAEIIDWSLPTYSIFESSKEIAEKYGVRAIRPLNEKTMRRIARGIDKYVLKRGVNTFFVANAHGLVAPFLTEYYGTGHPVSVEEPMLTITSKDRYNIVEVRIERYRSGADQAHWPDVRSMINQYCDFTWADDEVIEIGGIDYIITDICMRMITPRELFDAQGFPHDYIIDHDADGNKITRADQVARCGNAVCPPMAAACVSANFPEIATDAIKDMKTLHRLQV